MWFHLTTIYPKLLCMKQITLSAFIAILLFNTTALAKDKTDIHPQKQPLVPNALTGNQPDTLSQQQKKKLSREVLDSLFGKLHNVKSSESATLLANAIWKIWSRSGSPTADMLLRQAERAMRAGQQRVAISILSTIIDQYPDFAEAWNKRATAYFLSYDYDRSIADIKEVLKREPRHFGALSGLGLIYQRLGKNKKALKAFRRALAIHPFLGEAGVAVKNLSGDTEQDI